jgi:hypothetical protein
MQWCTAVILAPHEADTGGSQFMVRKKLQRPYFKNKLGVVAHGYTHSNSQGRGRTTVPDQSKQKCGILLIKPRKAKGLRVWLKSQYLHRRHEALSSIPSIAKINK